MKQNVFLKIFLRQGAFVFCVLPENAAKRAVDDWYSGNLQTNSEGKLAIDAVYPGRVALTAGDITLIHTEPIPQEQVHLFNRSSSISHSHPGTYGIQSGSN
jgi:hypothetical protein